jgi:hypothetical protein
MLETTNLSVSSLVAHANVNRETQHEMQLAIAHVLNNPPAGISIAQKQLALIVMLEELMKTIPAEFQAANNIAVVTTILMGSRVLSAAIVLPQEDDA